MRFMGWLIGVTRWLILGAWLWRVGGYEVYWGPTLDGGRKAWDAWRDASGALNVEMGRQSLILSKALMPVTPEAWLRKFGTKICESI